ncbi:MAG: membrane protein insertion efficiency factor YidD [Patescibacteria group bacterium]
MFKKPFIYLINLYQKTISPDHGFIKKIGLVRKPVCVFYPTCSDYSKQAIEKYGIFKGFYLTFFRITRCHPRQKKHMDPVP